MKTSLALLVIVLFSTLSVAQTHEVDQIITCTKYDLQTRDFWAVELSSAHENNLAYLQVFHNSRGHPTVVANYPAKVEQDDSWTYEGTPELFQDFFSLNLTPLRDSYGMLASLRIKGQLEEERMIKGLVCLSRLSPSAPR